jgi:hypothetical protein
MPIVEPQGGILCVKESEQFGSHQKNSSGGGGIQNPTSAPQIDQRFSNLLIGMRTPRYRSVLAQKAKPALVERKAVCAFCD